MALGGTVVSDERRTAPIHRPHVRYFTGRSDGGGNPSPWLPLQMALAKLGSIWLMVAIILWIAGW
jgi:hypothetical protein